MKRRVFVWIFICSLMLSSQYTYIQGEEEPEPFFTIDFLVPSTSWRRPWPALIAEELPKIGIGVDTYDETGWSQISPRTWGYPGPYPIPTYDDGGYDILFVGWSWGIFWDPSGLFESPSITPSGDNFYQYYNPKMDFAIANYTSSYLKDDLIYWIKEIQQMLYNDLPQIEIIYPASVYPYDENFSGWDGLLWAAEQQPIIDWKILGQNSFTYATPAGFDDFHPHQYGSIYDAQWLKQIFNGLLKQTPEQKNFFDNWITESYNTTNGLDFQIKLKDLAV